MSYEIPLFYSIRRSVVVVSGRSLRAGGIHIRIDRRLLRISFQYLVRNRCERIGATPINRAIGGQSILSTVKMMLDGTLYSREELERMDALVIMQVHDRDVYVSEDPR